MWTYMNKKPVCVCVCCIVKIKNKQKTRLFDETSTENIMSTENYNEYWKYLYMHICTVRKSRHNDKVMYICRHILIEIRDLRKVRECSREEKVTHSRTSPLNGTSI